MNINLVSHFQELKYLNQACLSYISRHYKVARKYNYILSAGQETVVRVDIT